jgi:hypothetical protein
MLPRDIFSYRSQGIYFNNKGEYVMSTLIKLTLIGWLLFCLPSLQTQATADTPVDCNNTSHILPQGQWHLISLPCQPNNAGTVASVLADDMGNQKLGKDWALIQAIATMVPRASLCNQGCTGKYLFPNSTIIHDHKSFTHSIY